MAISKNKQAVIDELKRQWRVGARWCAFKRVERIGLKEIKCFRIYSQAIKFYVKGNEQLKNSSFKIMVIADLLKELSHSAKNKRQVQVGISKIFLCEKYPPLSFPPSIDHIMILPEDRYFPVVWNKIINPVTDISEWLVISGNSSDAVIFGSKEYGSALNCFMKQAGKISKASIREELKLQAKLQNAAMTGNIDLYHFYYHARRGVYVLDKKLDETYPFLLQVTYFAKYNQRLKRLEFFDESLKKIVAGKIIGGIDVAYYDFE